MEAKNLMIGDLVYNHRKWICPIVEIHKDSAVVIARHYGEEEFKLDDLRAIPLTSEILEKNGWIYNNEDEKFFPQTWVGGGLMLQGVNDGGYRIVVTSDYDDEDTNDTPFIVLYVHELQHALRLHRIKKEIIL